MLIRHHNKSHSNPQERVEAAGGEKPKNLDLLDSMLYPDRGSGLNFLEVKDNIKTLLFAGHDTTAAAMSWLLYLFASERSRCVYLPSLRVCLYRQRD